MLDAREIAARHPDLHGESLLRHPGGLAGGTQEGPELDGGAAGPGVELLHARSRRPPRTIDENDSYMRRYLGRMSCRFNARATPRGLAGAAFAEATYMIQPPSPSPTPRILVVDDDRMVGRSLARALRAFVHVTVELSPEAALERIRRGERFDLILSDVMMPGMTGPTLFDRVVAIAPEQREVFVFVSGGMSDLLREMLAATGRPCLQKPVTTEAVLAQLGAVRSSRPT